MIEINQCCKQCLLYMKSVRVSEGLNHSQFEVLLLTI